MSDEMGPRTSPSVARAGHKWPAFDGLRALAVMAVMAYHVNIHHFLNGGYVGVDVFFVLSGFLITWLLTAERDRTGSIRYAKFYARRALRLLPALAAVLVAVLVLVQLDHSMAVWRHSTYISLPFVVFYSSNWVTAFTTLGTLGMLTITWSLAVEEQYYLVWPWVLNALSRRLTRPQVAWLLVSVAVAEMVARAVINLSGGSWLFADFSTVTHSDGLLIGSALALVWSLRPEADALAGLRRRSALIGTGGLAVLFVVVVAGSPTTRWMFVWIALAVVGTAGVIADLVVLPESWRARLLSLPPLLWIGRRSYACYLWHIPILTLLATVHLPTAHLHIERVVLMFALTFVVADLSYRVIELPFLRRKDHFRVVTAAP